MSEEYAYAQAVTSQPYRISRDDVLEARVAITSPGVAISPRKIRRKDLAGWVIFLSMAALLFFLNKQQSAVGQHSSVRSQPSHVAATVIFARIVIAISLFALLFTWFFVFRRLRLASEHGEAIVAQLMRDGVRFEQQGMRFELTWACFDGFLETPHLFVLRQGNEMRVIPKVALSDVNQTVFRNQFLLYLNQPGSDFLDAH